MREKMKNILKGELACFIWCMLFALLETGALIGVFAYQIKHSFSFQNKFFEAFDFIETADTLSDLDFSLEVMKALMKLADELVFPMLIISNIIIIIIFAIKLLKTKEKVIKRLSKDSIVKYMIIAITLNLVLSTLIGFIPASIMEKCNATVGAVTTGSLWLMLLTTGILGPVGEEILFRYFILKPNRRVSDRYAIILSALSFGIMHGNLIQGAYTFLLGLIFAYIDVKEDSLLPSIIMHITINTTSVLVASGWSNDVAGLAFYFCMITGIGLLLTRKQKELAVS